jgi:hypothetical protein
MILSLFLKSIDCYECIRVLNYFSYPDIYVKVCYWVKKDENLRTITKLDKFYTRFVDALQIVENKIDLEQELRKELPLQKNESIFVEVDRVVILSYK